jgi:hypothetical protein
MPVDDEGDNGLQFEVLAAALRSEHKQTGDLLEFLAKMLESSIPESTTITRDGWFMSSNRPVKELRVSLDDAEYQIHRGRSSNFTSRRAKMVRGVVLKTEEIPMDKCVDEILMQLMKLAEKNATARKALQKFVQE